MKTLQSPLQFLHLGPLN